jgi:hypothetical protein
LEPNESFYTAWTLGTNTGYSAYICDEYDLDYFQFFVDDNCHIDTYLTSLPINVDLFLYDQSGYLVGSSTNQGTDDEFIPYDVGKGGPFVILAQGAKGEFDAENPYKFAMDVSCAPPATETATPTEIPTATPTSPPICPDACEPNNWFGEAWPVSTGEDHFAYTCYEGDVDYFSFEVQDNCNIQAQVFPQTIDVDLYLLDPDGNVIGSSWSPGTENEWIDSTRSTGGVYVILVEPKKGEYSAEYSYKFRIDLWCAPPQTDTPTPTWTVIEPSPTHTATPSATLIEPSPTRTATPSATLIGPSPTGTATPSATLIEPSPTGTATPSATLIEPSPTPTATFTPPPPSLTPATCPDPYEPNNAFESAWEILPGDLNSFICGPTDQDWFQFAVNLGDTVELWLLNLPQNYDLILYDGSHNEQGRSQNGSTADEYVLVSDAKVAGLYRVLVSTGGESSRTQPYKLRLRITAGGTSTPTHTPTPAACNTDPSEPNDTFATAHVVWPGGWTQGYICPSSDKDFWKFAANAGDTIRLELRSLPADYDLYLWSPAGVEVAHSWNGGTTDELIVYHAPQSGDYRVEVRPVLGQWHATDPYDLRPDVYGPTPTPSPTATMRPGQDLRISCMEINQSIAWCYPGPLVAHKPTLVRLYIRTGAEYAGLVTHVTAQINIRDVSNRLAAVLLPENPGREITAYPEPERHGDCLICTLNFDVPDTYLEGTWIFEAWVNYDRRAPETNYDNNTERQTVTFTPITKRISIAYVPIHYHPAGYSGATDPTNYIEGPVSNMVRAAWPIPPGNLTYYRASVPPLDFTLAADHPLAAVNGLWARMDPQPDHLVGWLPADASRVLTDVLGYAILATNVNSPQHALWCMENARLGDDTLLHELTHNYSFGHHCGPADGQAVDVVGRRGVYNGRDVMCDTAYPWYEYWISRNTYYTLWSAWGGGGGARGLVAEARQAVAPTRYVIATGVITTAESAATYGALAPLEWVTRTLTADVPEGTAYCLEFRSSTQAVLQRSCFDTLETCGSAAYGAASFLHILPWPEGTTSVLLTEGATVLAQRAASTHPPTVQVLAPNGGETWDGELVVRWSGSDADGDALHYSVLYSPNGGVSWVPLVAETTVTTLTADSGYLAGGELGLVKVRASDGFATAEDISDAPFTVPRKPPEPRINAPEDGAWFLPEQTITLMGEAYDPEDGSLPDNDLEWALWTQSGSTWLGSGPLLTAGPLPGGDHVIVLHAYDSDGMEATDSVTIHVGEQPANAVYLPVVMKGT